jgi:hypothetical protein
VRRLKFMAVLLVIGVAIAIGFAGHRVYCGRGATLTFTNNSGQIADLVLIENGGKLCKAKGIERGGMFSCRIEDLVEGPGFQVQVALRNGKAFSVVGPGYVTGGVEYVGEISVDANGRLEFIFN